MVRELRTDRKALRLDEGGLSELDLRSLLLVVSLLAKVACDGQHMNRGEAS